MRLTYALTIPTTACLVLGLANLASAAIISLTPTNIHGDDTNTASFSNGDITITPFVHNGTEFVQDTFNAQPARLGIDNNGTNNNAIADADTVVGNAGDEALEFIFAADRGLSRISYDFSRADGPGPNDGAVITGFTQNPGVSFSVSDPNLFAVYDAGAGSVRLNIPGQLFGGAVVDVNFASLAASNGQTLLLTVNDTTQAGPQLAIRGIAYGTIPEPSTLALIGLGLPMLVRHRKR